MRWCCGKLEVCEIANGHKHRVASKKIPPNGDVWSAHKHQEMKYFLKTWLLILWYTRIVIKKYSWKTINVLVEVSTICHVGKLMFTWVRMVFFVSFGVFYDIIYMHMLVVEVIPYIFSWKKFITLHIH